MSNNYLIFSNLLPSLESIILYHNTNKSSLIKDFEKADLIRDDLLVLWYKIIDSREGSRLEKIR